MYGEDSENSTTEDNLNSNKSTSKSVSRKSRILQEEANISVPSSFAQNNGLMQETELPKPKKIGTNELHYPNIQPAIIKLKSPSDQNNESQQPKQAETTDKHKVVTQNAQQQLQKQQFKLDESKNSEQQTQQYIVSYQTNNNQQISKSPDFDHLSIACHLFPRLSKTNLQFHDISWNYEHENRRSILRKRIVKVSALLKVISLCYKKNVRPPVAQLSETMIYNIELSLIDCRPRADNQIVSNLFTVPIPLQENKTFFNKTQPLNVLIRSNYSQNEVMLRIVLRQPISGAELGSINLKLLNNDGNSIIVFGRTQSHLFGDLRLNFEFIEFSSRLCKAQADYLPDVLICCKTWIGMLACYRQLLCQIIAFQRENYPQSTWINDPILATFPQMMENEMLMNTFMKLLKTHCVLNPNGSIVGRTSTISPQTIKKFCDIYSKFILPFVNAAKTNLINYETLQKLINTIERSGPFSVLAEHKNPPLNIFDMTLHLSGNHALD